MVDGWGTVASLTRARQIIIILHLYGGGLLECCLSLSAPAVTASCLDSKLSRGRFAFPISPQRPERGFAPGNLEIKCEAKRVHEDEVTYQRGGWESPEPNSQPVWCYL